VNLDTAKPITWTYGKSDRCTFRQIFPQCHVDEIAVRRPLDRDPNTSVSLLEATYLCAIARAMQPSKILEIGTFDGNTTLNLAANTSPDCRVTSLDVSTDVGAQYKSSDLAHKIVGITDDSTRCDWSTLGGPFDLIFIDGCHTYEAARSDTRHAIDNLKPGGLILWHDYGSIHSVAKAVDEFAHELNISALQGTSLAVATTRN
jgi:predicted O-methyltransferase YrrM